VVFVDVMDLCISLINFFNYRENAITRTNVVQFALITGIVYFYFVLAKKVFCFPQDFYTINHDIKILCFFSCLVGAGSFAQHHYQPKLVQVLCAIVPLRDWHP
ncbi:MAG: hypothetical protein RBR47_14440, partial [Bacteroidales bacterium]|nr:hypothetical protein [Bacteroidales bacterium]MDY0336149.1 hypothetical protein [Bacteroidales bacterium]